MPMITKTIMFEAAHRLVDHGGKCKHLHGHSYKVEISLHSAWLDDQGMVVDFAQIGHTIGAWIQANWDHNIILQRTDPLAKLWKFDGDLRATQEQVEKSQEIFQGKEPYLMDEPPTAENLATLLFDLTDTFFCRNYRVDIESIVVWETPTSSATAVHGTVEDKD